MSTYQFLSPEWVDAVRELRARHDPNVPILAQPLRINLIVTQAPFEPSTVRGYIDTRGGELLIELGELANPDLAVTIAYNTAQRLFVERDEAAAMEAFLSGAMQVDGDLTVLFTLQAQTFSAAPTELAEKVMAITQRS